MHPVWKKYVFTVSTALLLGLVRRWSRWPLCLRRGSVAACLLGLGVRIPPGAYISVCCEFCLLSRRVLCVTLITRPEETYRLWCVWVWSSSLNHKEALAHSGLFCHKKTQSDSWYCASKSVDTLIKSFVSQVVNRRGLIAVPRVRPQGSPCASNLQGSWRWCMTHWRNLLSWTSHTV
jgi:hypothetical protein